MRIHNLIPAANRLASSAPLAARQLSRSLPHSGRPITLAPEVPTGTFRSNTAHLTGFPTSPAGRSYSTAAAITKAITHAPHKQPSQVVEEFASAHKLDGADLATIRESTKGVNVVVVSRITNPTQAAWLRESAIKPVMERIAEDPSRSTFQNEMVTKLTSPAPGDPFSNFAMHLAPGGQDGVHVHPYGPRNLVVMSDGPWCVLSGRVPKPGEDPASIKDVVRTGFEAGQYLLSFPANMPHGFESHGNTVAYSIHAFDEQEIESAKLQHGKDVADDEHIMSSLTRDLGDGGLKYVGDGIAIPIEVVQALHAADSAPQQVKHGEQV